MTKMPEIIKNKLRQLDKHVKASAKIQRELDSYFEKYNIPVDNLLALDGKPFDDENPSTEAYAYILNAEGDVEENIIEIEKVFINFANIVIDDD